MNVSPLTKHLLDLLINFLNKRHRIPQAFLDCVNDFLHGFHASANSDELKFCRM